MSVQRRFFPFVIASVLLTFASAQEIVVRPGDTLWDLARRHGTSIDALRTANSLVGSALQPGMKLSLPGDANAYPSSYTVKAGDTLYEIAVAFDLSVDTLIAYNDLEGTVIRPGQTLSLLTPDEELPPLVVTVAPGDTLWRLANDNDVTVAALAAANGILASAVLRPGHSLRVPGRYAGSVQDQGGSAAPIVTVAAGENLSVIARRHSTSVAALMAANELSGTNIRAGQRLRIVPGSELVRAAPALPPAPQAGVMLWPLHGELTSRFGYRRLRIGGSNMHYGLDIDGDIGDPVQAAVSGVVTFSGWEGGYGNLVVVENEGIEYYYAHAATLLVNVGAVVVAGETIATVGNTGRSTGSHLHFEIRVDGTPIDPLPILQTQAQR
ncbi:MAG: LysM peptidoglycan-binding domain-containing protein [Trueperaceae bacterium]